MGYRADTVPESGRHGRGGPGRERWSGHLILRVAELHPWFGGGLPLLQQVHDRSPERTPACRSAPAATGRRDSRPPTGDRRGRAMRAAGDPARNSGGSFPSAKSRRRDRYAQTPRRAASAEALGHSDVHRSARSGMDGYPIVLGTDRRSPQSAATASTSAPVIGATEAAGYRRPEQMALDARVGGGSRACGWVLGVAACSAWRRRDGHQRVAASARRLSTVRTAPPARLGARRRRRPVALPTRSRASSRPRARSVATMVK